MNNEEKILQMLGQVVDRLDRVDGRLDKLEAAQAQQGERLDEMQETLTRVAVTQEGVVLPRIQLALEGHSELKREIGTLATKEQMEEIVSDVDVIKAVVTRHSGDISELKKAQ